MNKKIKFLKFQLGTAIFVLVTVLVSGFFVFGPELSEVAKALTGNYNKANGGSLTISDWNNLDDDFVAKSGDTMTGALTVPSATVQNNLTVNGKITSAQTLGTDSDSTVATKKYVDDNAGGGGGAYVDEAGDTMTGLLTLSADPVQPLQAATKQYVDAISAGGNYVDKTGDTMTGVLDMSGNRISGLGAPTADTDAVSQGVMNTAIVEAIGGLPSDVKNFGGSNLKMICDKTSDTDWYDDPAPNTIGVDINIPVGAFSATPLIFTSLGGTNYQFKAIGGSNVYFVSSTGFTVFVSHLDRTLDSVAADTWNWYLNWCAVGQ